ncbi:hypothetical protein V5T82_17205 [Magnetovibrio sp. PR-2]|uniref:hypothetical protein n=1 Tax=Magnetovibrio sp. PR-2 TaxID=3120356 RepID=UPI002FCE1165
MSTFYTEIPIIPSKTSADFMQLGIEWISGMRDSTILSSNQNITDSDDVFLRNDHESLKASRVLKEDSELFGLQHIKHDDENRIWTSEFVTNKQEDSIWLSVKVKCDSTVATSKLPIPKKPYFVKMVMKEDWGGMDGIVQAQDLPHHLEETHIELATSLITRQGKNRLPIVYISADNNNEYAVKPISLAFMLGGLAHVIVEPSRSFSISLATKTARKNAYGGSIGVYWPDDGRKKSYYLGGDHNNEHDITNAILRDIVFSLSNKRAQTRVTWQHLREQIAQQAIQNLKKNESTELSEYIKQFDDEIRSKDELLAISEQEIERLQGELSIAIESQNADTGAILQPGVEQDLFLKERREIVVWALEKALTATNDSSRRQHIIQDLIEENRTERESERIKKELKKILPSYKGMNAKLRSSLADLGFDISTDGKHCKAIFGNDTRYQFTFPKTPSDNRTGKNMVSDINKKLFL